MVSDATPRAPRVSTVLAAVLLIAIVACRRDDARATDSAAGVLPADTAAASKAPTPAAPAPQPTAEDAKAVSDALEFKLTDDNLNKFIQAGNRLAFLRARDPQIRAYLESIGGSRAPHDDSAVERLERNAQVSKAITDAGLSVRDYYTMALAIGSAQRFVDNPNAAPPTPTLSENAKFLRDHKQYLAHLRVWGQ
jgi:hypothetical protein